MKRNSANKILALFLSFIMTISLLVPIALAPVASAVESGATYYVSNNGDDGKDGKSVANAWKSLDKVNSTTFQPGDSILFEDGGVWNGTLWPKGSGSAGGGEITIADYKGAIGTAKPIINGPASRTATSGPDTTAIYLYNQEYWTIKNLEITNYDPADLAASTDGAAYYDGALANRVRRGIYVLVDDSCTVGDTSKTIPYNWDTADKGSNQDGTIGVRNLSHIYMQNLDIHDVKGDDRFGGTGKGTGGIYVYIITDNNNTPLNTRKPTKYDDIRIENCNIKDVGRTGISMLSDWQISKPLSGQGRCRYWMSNVLIQNNTLNRIGGDGIIVIGLDQPMIQYNTVANSNYANMRGANYTDAWSVGMFPFFTSGTTMQYNEVYNTRTTMDGEAIDVDGNNNGTNVQYNFTHDNEGGSFLVMVDSYVNSTGQRNSTTVNTTIRYNVVQNDLKNVFVISNGISNLKVYNNTIYLGSNMTTGVVWQKQKGNSYGVDVPAVSHIAYTNNLFYNLGSGGYQINQTAGDIANGTYGNDVTFENNWYYGKHPSSEPAEIGKAARTDNPVLTGSSFPNDKEVNSTTKISDLHDRINVVPQFKLKSTSPLIDAGIKVHDFDRTTVVSGDPDGNWVFNGPELNYGSMTDFWGQSALTGATTDIGAFESPVSRTFDPQYGAIFSYGAEEGVKDSVAAKSIIATDSSVTVDGSKASLSVVNAAAEGITAKDGSKVLKLSTTGLLADEKASLKLFDFSPALTIPSTGDTYVSFWLYAADNNARYVSLDGEYNTSAGGTAKIRNSSLIDTEYGTGFDPQSGHGSMPSRQWVHIYTKITDANMQGGSVNWLAIRVQGPDGAALGSTTCYIDDIRLTPYPAAPAAPTAGNVSIKNDTASVGSTSSGLYTYADVNGEPEAGSVYQWYISNAQDGAFVPITGAAFDSYNPKVADVGKWIKFGVKPANSFDLGTAGIEAASTPIQVKGFNGTAGFETGEFAPASTVFSSMCFKDVAGETSSEQSHSGSYSYKVSGLSTNKNLPSDGIFFMEKLFDTAYQITSNTKLVYWIYPTNAESAYTAVDFIMSSGTLRDSGAKDMTGASVHPNKGHIGTDGKPLPINQWSQIVINLSGQAGKTINTINIMGSQSVGGVNVSAYFDDIALIEGTVPELAPVAHSLGISGTTAVYQTLQGTYTYRSAKGTPQSGTSMQWSVSDDGISNWVPIVGATSSSYKLKAADETKYIQFSVTPKNANLTGATASTSVGPVAPPDLVPKPPVAASVKISGEKRAGTTLQGSYQYIDVNGEDESGSTYRWLEGDTSAGPFTTIQGAVNKSLPLTVAQANKHIVFEVTPANTAVEYPTGTPVQSASFGPINGFSGVSGFEAGEFQPAIAQVGINGVTNAAAVVSNEQAYSGTSSLKISGHGAGGQSVQYRIFNTQYLMTANTVMSYWIYATNAVSRYDGVDFSTKSFATGSGGPTLRDSGQTDLTGAPMHPNGGHKAKNKPEIPLNQWVQVISTIGGNTYLRGTDNTISEVRISFMCPTGTWIGGESDFVAYIDNIQFTEGPVPATTPIAYNANITGVQKVNATLTASYDYRDAAGKPESGSMLQWYRSDSESGSFTPIAGATNLTYTTTPSDLNKYIKFEVTPKSNTPAAGTPVSKVVGPVQSQLYTVTATASEYGTITPLSLTVNAGEDAVFAVEPESGYSVDAVTGGTYDVLTGMLTVSYVLADTSVSVSFAAHAPVFDIIAGQNVDEGKTLTFNVSATDADGGSLTYTSSGLPAGASFDAAIGQFSWTPGFDQAGSYAVHFDVSDGMLTTGMDVVMMVRNVTARELAANLGEYLKGLDAKVLLSQKLDDVTGAIDKENYKLALTKLKVFEQEIKIAESGAITEEQVDFILDASLDMIPAMLADADEKGKGWIDSRTGGILEMLDRFKSDKPSDSLMDSVIQQINELISIS